MSTKSKNSTSSPRTGRPCEGFFPRTVDCKVRIDPYMDEALIAACKHMGITKAEGIRQGISLFLKEAGKLMRRG